MNGIKYAVVVFFVLFIGGCMKQNGSGRNVPVARVFDDYLYSDDLQGIIPAGLAPADSIAIAQDFIDNWVRSRLILNKAELNLTDEERDVEQQIENYRTSLLVHLYEQSFIRQELDTIVSDQEIEEYLNENSSNFILSDAFIRGSFIQVPASAPDIYRLRQWCNDAEAENTAEIETYCHEYAEKYDHFNDDWVNLSEVVEYLPRSLYSPESTVRSRRLVEMRDQEYYYFLRVKEYALSGELAPFSLVHNDIRNILINKRKINILNELETSIYNDGQNRGSFTIY